MKFFMAASILCPICKTSLSWDWEEDGRSPVLFHAIHAGIFDCVNAGKRFKASTIELKETEYPEVKNG